MIYIVKRKKPNTKLIKHLRWSIKCTQASLLAEMKNDGYEISRRTYQKMEHGEETQITYFEKLIKFYTKRLPIKHAYKNIKIEDLIFVPKKTQLSKKLKKVVISKKKEGSKNSDEFVGILENSEQVVMYKILNFEDIVKNISISTKRKFFYKVNTAGMNLYEGTSGTDCIKAIVRQIDEFKKNKIQSNNDEFGNESNEFKKLEEVTEFAENITRLHNWGVSLYVGLLYLPQYSWKPVDPHPANDHYEY